MYKVLKGTDIEHTPHVLFIGGWTKPLQDALDRGYTVSYIGFFAKHIYFDGTILEECFYKKEIDTTNIPVCVYYAEQLYKEKPFDVVVSFNEVALDTASIIAKIFNVKGVSYNANMITRNKDMMREIVAGKDFSIDSIVCKNSKDIDDFLNKKDSIIIKPPIGAGGKGVSKLDRGDDVEAFIKNNRIQLPILVEEYVEGDVVYTVEAVSYNKNHSILAISAEIVKEDTFIINHTIMPAPLDESQQKLIIEKVMLFLDDMQLEEGITHTEIKLNKQNKPIIIESQVRIGGGNIWKMVELTTGISQFGYFYDALATGTIDEFRCVPSKCHAMSLSLIPKPGCLKEIKYKGLADISEVVLIDLLVKEGDTIPIIVDGTGRKGYILFTANDINHMYEVADKICDNITFVYEDLTEWKPSFRKII
ncbi:ATP-grasp domain-containing protein [Paenibacillus sp. L3-i20]|uniref:ATP-grasp domain-containing protein n=1 Tax=Paenibacillus sp. L3-i20 TaxID=2905833 RepID=UPI001EE0FFB8|nr:ATP-grasp domain-containing protein [Paenibacillus sp. L3-i20]GKU79117.1 carbamoyl phosphate synthase large subunit [Paenibacillus sp. L3-i20]